MAGIILALGVGGLSLYGFWPALTGADDDEERAEVAEPEGVRSAVVGLVLEEVDFPLRAEATGHLAPWRSAEISAEASGLIVERPIEEGHRVRQGDLLLRLDDREQRIALSEAESMLLKARADYAVARRMSGEVAEADTSRLAALREQWQEASSGFEQGLVTADELQRVRRLYEVEDVLSGRWREAVLAVNNDLAQSEQRLERAQLNLDRTRVLAPFTGRVADLDVELGQRAAAGQKLMLLLQDDRMKVETDVLEADLVYMRVGASANVRVPNFSDEVYQGQVYSVNPLVTAEAGTGRVTVALSNPDGRLVAGLHTEVALETTRLSNRLVVPSEAVRVRQGRDLVFKAHEGNAYWTYVNVGARSEGFLEILGPASTISIGVGDTVFVDGHRALAHDVPVEITSIVSLGLR